MYPWGEKGIQIYVGKIVTFKKKKESFKLQHNLLKGT